MDLKSSEKNAQGPATAGAGHVIAEQPSAEVSPLASVFARREHYHLAGELATAIDGLNVTDRALLDILQQGVRVIGTGREREVGVITAEGFDNFVFARNTSSRRHEPITFSLGADPYPVGNVGQVIGTFENAFGRTVAEVMLKQRGYPLRQVMRTILQEHTEDPRTDEPLTVEQLYSRFFSTLGSLPQEAFDQLAREVVSLTRYRGAVDSQNIDNVLLDHSIGSLKLVDVAFSPLAEDFPQLPAGNEAAIYWGNTIDGIAMLLFDQQHYNLKWREVEHAEGSELQLAEKLLLTKILLGGREAKMQAPSEGPPMSFIYSRNGLSGADIVKAYNESTSGADLKARLESLLPASQVIRG